MIDGESHLYGPDGKFLFVGKKLGICALCGAKGDTFSVGALGLSYRFCRGCIRKEGPRELRRESNLALQRVKSSVTELKTQWDAMQERYMARFGVPVVIHKKG